MSSSEQLLASDPSAFRRAYIEGDAAVGMAYPSSFTIHAKVIAGVYGVMILLWLLESTQQGILRPNGAIIVPLLLAVYSALWIALICADALRHDQSGFEGTETFQLAVFVPLSLAGWVQVYSTVCAIPFREGLVNERDRKPIYRSRLTRILESAHLRNLILVANPCIYLTVLIIPAILAGRSQSRAYRYSAEVMSLLDEAVSEGGWRAEDLAACGKAVLDVESTFNTLKTQVRWGAGVILFWSTLEASIYITSSLALWRILNRQISQLRRTIANAVTLQNLSQAALMPAPAPTFFPNQRYINLPPLKCHSEEIAVGECSSAPNDRQLGDFRARLGRLRAFRRVYIYQALATGYTMIAAVIYGAFGAGGGFFVNIWTGRDVPLFVPFYGFLLPAALPASILSVYFFLNHQTPSHAACAKAAAASTEPPPPAPPVEEGEWEPSTAGAVLKGEKKWEVSFKTVEQLREGERSVSKGSAGPSEEEGGWAMVGRPSEWARTAGGKRVV